MHTQVEYVVAHGISSLIDGSKALIGSRHFVFENEGCTVPAGEEEKAAGRTVIMVGDGINDSPALSAADGFYRQETTKSPVTM